MRPKFTILDPNGSIKVTSDGYVVTKAVDAGWGYALLTPQISAHSPPAYAKLKINKLTSGYAFLGVIGNSLPPSGSSSFKDPTFYGFQNGAAHAGGHGNTIPISSYGQFQMGDTVMFQLDTTAHTLKMVINRLAGRVFTITGLKDIPAYWFYVSLSYANDQVEVLDVTPSDIKLFF